MAVTAAFAKLDAAGRRTTDICVLLPDTEVVGPLGDSRTGPRSSPRPSRRPGSRYAITNADGDAQKQKSQADQCLANGAKVVILVSLDAGSSIAIEKAAAAKGAKSIDYDRQVKGGTSSIYISFDGATVGVLQGQGVVAGLKANGMYSKKPVVARALNGGQTDNNSYLFKSGYDSILKPLYQERHAQEGPGAVRAGLGQPEGPGAIFEQMLVKTSNKIDAVAAANDGLANAVVVALKAKA